MAWIETISPEEATGELRETYSRISGARGLVAEVHQVQSLNPRAMKAHFELYKSVVFSRSSLSRAAREAIAVVVSAVNGCPYCMAHHGEALQRLGESPATVEALAAGEIPDTLSARRAALLSWARAAARAPGERGQQDLEGLREHGFDERALLDATLTVAYFSFVNRLVLLLGVGLEDDFAASCGELEQR